MELDYFLAKCPQCGTRLTLGWTDIECRKCDDEFLKSGDYEGRAKLQLRIMDELDTRQLIIPKKKLEELKEVLSQFEAKGE